MATVLSPINCVLFLFVLLCSYGSRVHGDDQGLDVLRIKSLMTANACTISKAPSENSLKVVHRYGPCFASGDGQPDHRRMLSRDMLRVAYLQNEIQLATGPGNTSVDNLGAGPVTLRALDGEVIGSDSYVVTIGIGTPKRDQTVIFDTGSNLCWVQCMPCYNCYHQHEPIFNPSASSSYHNIPATAPPCTNLPREQRGRTGDDCTYRVNYDDSSRSGGHLATETLRLTNTTVIPTFVLGCGLSNRGFKGSAGLFGLGRNYHSLVSQAPSSLGKVFSYCLPTSSSISGHLTIGRSAVRSPSFTPMLSRPNRSPRYYIDLVGITVGTQRLQAPPTVFQSVGTLIDSGTTISRLPPVVYTELRNAFRSGMTRYRLVAPFSMMDTCYDFSNVRNSPVYPRITLHFAGHSSSGVNLVLKPEQVFYVVDASQVCLGFAATDRSNESGIIGMIQQRGMDLIYDLDEQKIGFAPENCG